MAGVVEVTFPAHDEQFGAQGFLRAVLMSLGRCIKLVLRASSCSCFPQQYVFISISHMDMKNYPDQALVTISPK